VKIYNEIVFDVDGNVVYEDSYEYSDGDVMLLQPDVPDMNADGFINMQDYVLYQKMKAAEGDSGTEDILQTVDKVQFGGDGTRFLGGDAESDEFLATDIDPTLLTANPMPSLPSISNVGAIPFSGSTSWSAIPGGFQPLPQIAGGRKKLYQLSKFHGGINQRSSPRDISDTECQDAINVTFSQVGRIKLLGDIKSTGSLITSTTLSDDGVPSPGYGLFIFKSGYSLAADPVQGNYTINVSQDGGNCQLADNTVAGAETTTLRIQDEHTHCAPVFYASGSGLYACNANLKNNDSATNDLRQVAMLVYREDINGAVEVKGWVTGNALITSPTYHTTSSDTASVNLQATHANSAATGRAMVTCDPTADVGTWKGTYNIYISWLFDNGCETGLTAIGNTGSISDKTLDFNISIQHTNAAPLGGNKRIEGARVYFREQGTVERWMLAEVKLVDGVKGALDSTFTPWDNPGGGSIYDLAANITFVDPPAIYSYLTLNGYYANEMYDKSSDSLSDDANGPAPHDVRYRTATIGSNGAAFIGAVMFRGKVHQDRMMFSMPNKPGLFPELNVFDSPSSDGTPIVALMSFQDKILQFKENAMYVVNISNPSQFYTEASFRDCGISNPCQAFHTPFGIIFANRYGCFIYDGTKIISLTNGKFTRSDWGLSDSTVADALDANKDAANVPCVGYDPRTQSIIVLRDIGNDSADTSAWVYNMGTQSWTAGTSMITNTSGDRHTNFVISPNGYLCIQKDGVEELKTYDAGQASSDVQTITYITKDIDFGSPTQTKKIFKIYLTYQGSCTALTGTYGVNGDTALAGAMTNSETSDATLQAAGVTDHNVATFTLNSHPASVKSIALKFTGSVGESFEINDISILYRARPIK